MKFSLIVCLLLLGAAFTEAGELPPGGGNGDSNGDNGDNGDLGDDVLICLVGEIVNGEGAESVTLQPCSTGDVCQTFIISKVGFFANIRECKQQQACMNNASGNVPRCYPGENNVRVCNFCCNSDICNDFIDIPDQ